VEGNGTVGHSANVRIILDVILNSGIEELIKEKFAPAFPGISPKK